MATDIKIKHAAVISDEALDKLYYIATDAASKTYPNVEEMNKALESAKVDFETLLNRYLHKAFKAGKKIGKEKADTKDTGMYVTTNPVM
jgi:hypothetical protein